MSGLEVLQAIVLEFANSKTVAYVVGMLALSAFCFFWRRNRHTRPQRRVVLVSLSLWLCIPASMLLAAAFHFSGPDSLRGIEFSQVAALLVASMLVLVFLGSLLLLVLGKGVRPNVLASSVALVFAQFWVGLVSGCAIVGRCV